MGFGLLKNHGDIQHIVEPSNGFVDVDGPMVVIGFDGDDDFSVFRDGMYLDTGYLEKLRAHSTILEGTGIYNGAGDIQSTSF